MHMYFHELVADLGVCSCAVCMPLAGRVGNPERRVPGSTSRHLTTERFYVAFLGKSDPGAGGGGGAAGGVQTRPALAGAPVVGFNPSLRPKMAQLHPQPTWSGAATALLIPSKANLQRKSLEPGTKKSIQQMLPKKPEPSATNPAALGFSHNCPEPSIGAQLKPCPSFATLVRTDLLTNPLFRVLL